MLSFVLGFAFGPDDAVVLIEKRRPEWQNGLLNGVGGKVEKGEDYPSAMVREFREETGCVTQHSDWQPFALLSEEGDFPAWQVVVFRATLPTLENVKSMTDEPVMQCNVKSGSNYTLPAPTLPNLEWLIPLAFDRRQGKSPIVVVAKYPKGSQ